MNDIKENANKDSNVNYEDQNDSLKFYYTSEDDETEDKADLDDNKSGKKKKTKDKKNSNKKENFKNSFKSRKFKGGAYATLLSVAALAIIIVINLIFNQLSINIDLTGTGDYTLTDETIDYVKDVDANIIIYYMVQSGAATTEIEEIVKQYDGLGKNMKLEYKDPVQYPKFASSLVDGADSLSNDNIIVYNSDNGRAKLITFSELIVTSYSYNSSTYSYDTTYTSDVEGQMDSAIQYVTNEELPKMYIVTSHGETTITDTEIEGMLSDENYEMEELDTLTIESIPDDCDILFISIPLNDYTTTETEMISDYLKSGGNVVVVTSYLSAELENFHQLIADFGIDMVEGIVFEDNSKYTSSSIAQDKRLALLLSGESHDITSGFKTRRVVSYLSTGLTESDEKSTTAVVTSLLSTTDESYSHLDLETTTERQDEDIAGPFSVAMIAEDTFAGAESKLLVFGSPYILYDSFVASSTYANGDLFLNAANYMTGVDNAMSIRTRTIGTYDTISLDTATQSLYAFLYMGLIPLVALGIGITIVVIRRRK